MGLLTPNVVEQQFSADDANRVRIEVRRIASVHARDRMLVMTPGAATVFVFPPLSKLATTWPTPLSRSASSAPCLRSRSCSCVANIDGMHLPQS
ncbi:MAG: hypothetical protein ACYTGR_09890 [Planctomycetota bacterium]|jgi:hypothetical protein